MAKDLYGSMGSADYRPDTGGDELFRMSGVRASPDAFGAQVGQAQKFMGQAVRERGSEMERAGGKTMDLAVDYAQEAAKEEAMAVEAKANDEWANQYIPQAVAARTQFDMAEGRDKIGAYQKYRTDMEVLNKKFVDTSATDYERQLKTSMAQKRLIQETESAGREMGQAYTDLARTAAADKMMSDVGFMAQNYNNQALVDDTFQSIDGLIEMRALDDGVDISSPDGREMVDQLKNKARGDGAVAMINRALESKDAVEANKLRAQYGPFIPGHQQLAIDRTLATENLRQTSEASVRAVLNGQQMPEPTGWPPVEVQATVADTAQEHGLHPNIALTTAMIETSMGQNLGKRGDVGQTGRGGDLKEQSFNMVTELKKSQERARAALGREPEPWEIYICYQQGAGGGPALLKAAMANPEARAADVLAPLYKNPKLGFDAIVHNGGNANMTSGQFLDLIKRKWEHNALLAACDVPATQIAPVATPEGATMLSEPQGKTLGQSMRDTMKQTGPALQPGPDPLATLNNFKETAAAWKARINSIPWEAQRAAKTREFEAYEGLFSAEAEKYKSAINERVDKEFLYNDQYTDIKQVPADLIAQMRAHPDVFGGKLDELRTKAASHRGANADPVMRAEMYAKVDSFFEKALFSDGVSVKPGKLDDIEKTRLEILSMADTGQITGDDANSLLKTLQVNLARMPGKSTAEFGGDHYATAYKTFADTGASIPEINRMFADYVQISGQQKFDQLPPRTWDQYWNKEPDKKQVYPQDAISAITTRYAESKYAPLVVMPEKPNAVIGKDGSHLVINWEAPKGKADTRIDDGSSLHVINGKTFKVSADGKKMIRVQ